MAPQLSTSLQTKVSRQDNHRRTGGSLFMEIHGANNE